MRRRELFIILILILALLPYFYICGFAMPFADDYCYAWTSGENKTFIHRFLYQYFRWSGRYSAHVLLCNHPLVTGKLFWYQAPLFAGMLGAGLALFMLLCRFFDRRTAAIGALVSLLFFLCYIPQLTEGVYWFTGICNYELSTVCFIFHLALLMLWYRGSGVLAKIYFTLAALLLIITIGFNEIAALLMPSYYLIAMIFFYRKQKTSPEWKKLFHASIILFLIAFASSSVLALAPGNLVRSSKFHDHVHVLRSLYYATLQTVRFTARWLCTLPALALSLLIISKANKTPDSPVLKFDFRIIAMLMIYTVFIGSLLPYLTTGILGQHRTINYVFSFFILLWPWMLISMSKQYELNSVRAFSFIDRNSTCILFACVVIMTLSGNGWDIVQDLRHDRFAAYKNEFLMRQDNIIRHPTERIPDLKNIPQTFKITDAMSDSTYWIDQCMRYSQIELK